MSEKMLARIKQEATNVRVDIRSLRQKKGISVRQMANELEIDSRNYSQMERGLRAMPAEKYKKFLKIIEI